MQYPNPPDDALSGLHPWVRRVLLPYVLSPSPLLRQPEFHLLLADLLKSTTLAFHRPPNVASAAGLSLPTVHLGTSPFIRHHVYPPRPCGEG